MNFIYKISHFKLEKYLYLLYNPNNMRNLILIGLIIALISIAGCGQEAKITGKAVSDVAVCDDTDGGDNIDVKGTVSGISSSGENFIHNDECVAGLLIEYYCEDKSPKNHNQRCPNKCSDGACI